MASELVRWTKSAVETCEESTTEGIHVDIKLANASTEGQYTYLGVSRVGGKKNELRYFTRTIDTASMPYT